MKASLFSVTIFLLVVGGLIYFKFYSFQPDDWKTSIPQVGFASSPRAVELTNDGVLDLVLGAGGSEFEPTQTGVLAIDGKNGAILWSVPTVNQVVGSAIFKDITSDGIPDVFIGGRSAILLGIDGHSGRVIWEHQAVTDSVNIIDDTTYLNFFSPQFIKDIDGDGLEDLLNAFGGYIKAKPDEKNRPTGSLKIISSRNGQLLSQFPMPDGGETYMSPLVHDFKNDGHPSVIFGSGGETTDGYLYCITLEDLVMNQASTVDTLASGNGKGFVASPVLADVNLDGILDIIANPVNGRMICLNGLTHEKMWEVPMEEDFEVYSMPAPGFFTGNDVIPDFYSSLGRGPWPDTEFTIHILVDGKNGSIISLDTLGLFQYASPVVYDFNHDGTDEIILMANHRQIVPVGRAEMPWYVHEIKIVDVKNRQVKNFEKEILLGSNLGSTPLFTDLDQDGWLDLVYCYMADPHHFYSFTKGIIHRYEKKNKDKQGYSLGKFYGKKSKWDFYPCFPW